MILYYHDRKIDTTSTGVDHIASETGHKASQQQKQGTHMRNIILLMTLLALTLYQVNSNAQLTEHPAPTKKELATESWATTPDPGLPNVLILGDSISIDYFKQVRHLLEGKANVFRPHNPDTNRALNCGGTTRGVEEIDHWLGGQEWDVIHFNWGLHDLKRVTESGGNETSKNPDDPYQATVEQYQENLQAIVAKLKATGARLIFATTTPVVPNSAGPYRDPEDPARYNTAALSIMHEHDIAIDDLNAASLPELSDLQKPRNVHFTDLGSQFLAEQVAGAIEQALNLATSNLESE